MADANLAATAQRLKTVLGGRLLNSGRNASLKATALAAMTCVSGPPCMPGNMAELSVLQKSSSCPLARMMPPRGPLRVLWVVLVTTWA
jgi:hypothetical protein